MEDELGLWVAQQQQELMDAKSLDSDLELAFRIQLQEALSASLLLHHPSSSSTLPAASSDPNAADDLSNAMNLQALELELFLQERRDRDLCQTEMRRMSADLKLRAHDGKFALEIQDMPDDDWDELGDNYQKPIEVVGSSSAEGAASSHGGEPFRIYFKGLVSREMVKGVMVELAAIGVGICDPRDNSVLNIKKPLVGSGVSRLVAEIKALMEGLQAALSLDIKAVNVYCDYLPLYKYMTGQWPVKQRKITNLIEQVHPIQRKFQRYRIHLLPRCHVKFAFQLAREAIDSQITRTHETGNETVKETCTICLEDNDVSQIYVVDGCLHRYCFSCMKQHVEVKLLHGVLPGCPKDGCQTKLNVNSSRKFLPPKMVEIMSQRIREASIPEADRLYCPHPKCSALMSKSETTRPQEESSSSYHANFAAGQRKCVKCSGFFCLHCKVPWHQNMSCSEYRMFNPYYRSEDAKLQSLARQKLWRQCIKCKHMIELVEGCYHMTCRCGYEFCYTCGAEWKNKRATCSCPLWDEVNIWHDRDDDSDYFDDSDYESEEDDYF